MLGPSVGETADQVSDSGLYIPAFKVWDVGAKTWNNNLIDCITGTCTWNGTDRFNAGCK